MLFEGCNNVGSSLEQYMQFQASKKGSMILLIGILKLSFEGNIFFLNFGPHGYQACGQSLN